MATNDLKSILETQMGKGTERNVKNQPLSQAIERLAIEGEALLATGRHAWVQRRTTDLVDASNWPAYTMELHFTHALEAAGHTVRNSVALIQGDKSDVDLVVPMDKGISINMECVFALEPLSYWQKTVEVAPGITISSASYDGNSEVGLLRKLQDKMRLKTISRTGNATKFPIPDETSVNILVVEVSQGLGSTPDSGDLKLITLGQGSVHPIAKRALLGLFENTNQYAPDYAAEFLGNKYLRERIHGVLWFIDESSWQGPLNPTYSGYFVSNPLLPLNEEQREAVTALRSSLTESLITKGWLPELKFTTTTPSE